MLLGCAARRDDNVIDLAARLRAVPPADTPLDGADPDSPAGRLAINLQVHYKQYGLSLADPETADVHRAALAWALLMVDGAHSTGVIDEEQAGVLQRMLMAAQDAPDAL